MPPDIFSAAGRVYEIRDAVATVGKAGRGLSFSGETKTKAPGNIAPKGAVQIGGLLPHENLEAAISRSAPFIT